MYLLDPCTERFLGLTPTIGTDVDFALENQIFPEY